MATTVVNIRWEACDVYVGRSRRGSPASKWGNPFVVGRPPPRRHLIYMQERPEAKMASSERDLNREEAITLYRTLIEERLRKGDLTKRDFEPLRGRKLGCFCKPQPCHADVLVEITERLFQDE